MSVTRAALPGPRRFKRFPPASGNLRVPVGSRASAAAAIALWPACRPSALRVRRVARDYVRLVGARLLPGFARPWDPPTGEETWTGMIERWSRAVGPIRSWSVYERTQTGRDGFAALLLDEGRPIGFAKVRAEGRPIEREWRAMRAMEARNPSAFEIPRPVATGETAGWHWWLSEALPPGLHTPPNDPPIGELAAEIAAALEILPRPDGTPGHWTPMHGDLTPWNLRAVDGRLILIDWEEAGWGPPRADEVLYRAAQAALGGPRRRVAEADEAIGYWRDRSQRRVGREAGGESRDRRLARGLVEALAWMRSATA